MPHAYSAHRARAHIRAPARTACLSALPCNIGVSSKHNRAATTRVTFNQSNIRCARASHIISRMRALINNVAHCAIITPARLWRASPLYYNARANGNIAASLINARSRRIMSRALRARHIIIGMAPATRIKIFAATRKLINRSGWRWRGNRRHRQWRSVSA